MIELLKFSSIKYRCALNADQVAEMCELFATKQMNEFQLAKKYKLHITTIDRYLDTHYLGLIPKDKQVKITLQSKINQA